MGLPWPLVSYYDAAAYEIWRMLIVTLTEIFHAIDVGRALEG